MNIHERVKGHEDQHIQSKKLGWLLRQFAKHRLFGTRMVCAEMTELTKVNESC